MWSATYPVTTVRWANLEPVLIRDLIEMNSPTLWAGVSSGLVIPVKTGIQ